MIFAYKIVLGKPQEEWSFGRPWYVTVLDWIHLDYYKGQWQAIRYDMVMKLWFPYKVECL
jgi:hypothetical protein